MNLVAHTRREFTVSPTDCPACGVAGMPASLPYRHTHPVLGGLVRASCANCGMVFASPMPAEQAWADYNSSYFDNAHGGAATDPVAAAFHSAMGYIRVAHVVDYLRTREVPVSSVLEVGPGSGDFARHWLARDPGSTYHAVESDVSCHPILLQMGIHLHSGPEALPSGESVDLVVLSHVLEHVRDPTGFLRAMTAHLRPGGVLFVEVPCRDWEHKERDEPHLLFFDKAPMRHLLERIGFAHLRLSYHGLEIARLRRRGFTHRIWSAVRFRLLSGGVVAPFALMEGGLEGLGSGMERAAVRPFQPHREKEQPAWWLRSLAIKR